MKLIDLLCVVDENSNIVVVDTLDNELSRYDGKNSIDEMYNNYDIVSISHKTDAISVMIDL